MPTESRLTKESSGTATTRGMLCGDIPKALGRVLAVRRFLPLCLTEIEDQEQLHEKELYELLARQGIRLFALSLGSVHVTLIHHSKSVNDWRADIRRCISEIKRLRNKSGWANDKVFNQMVIKFRNAGYFDVTDVVDDVYEGRVAVYSAGIEDDPSHEEQADGFGIMGGNPKRDGTRHLPYPRIQGFVMSC